MDLALEEVVTTTVKFSHPRVSILVFMDLALEGDYLEIDVIGIVKFQSLFLWILLSKRLSCQLRSHREEFQSLFLWILLSKLDVSIRSSTKCVVSILVFMDLALEGDQPEGQRPFQRVSILVFMDLALEESYIFHDDTTNSSFNPCFYGSCSRSY